ncbi:MAG TPA: hypothetical protein VMX38_23185 [Verrucomicrobiae bacterium]|nr:hypothetical protein [Verrucomicrobiae bacterium]
MTVCVAAIAAKSKAIVMIADKAITYGTERPMLADVGIKKILPIGETGWHALIAGDPSFAKEVIDRCVEDISDKGKPQNAAFPATARSMMHCLRDAYKAVRGQVVSDKVLSPLLLTEDKLSTLPESLQIQMYENMSEVKITCSLLVCGFDLKGVPHIFSINSPGIAANHDIPGFHAVGIGRDVAIGEFYRFETEVDESLEAALYEAFDAKATAELILGVGYEWDCSVLVADKEPKEITTAARKAMEGILEEASASPYHPKWGEHFDKVPQWKETLKVFADGIIKPSVKRRKPSPKSKSQRSKPKP